MMFAHAAAHNLHKASAFLPAYEQFDSIIALLQSSQAQKMSHSDLEKLIETEGRELLRRLLQAHLDERGPGTTSEPVRGAEGKLRSHLRLHTRSLESIFGPVTLTRLGYGCRAAASLHPLDSQLNLPPELYSHTIRRHVAQAAAKESFDEVVLTIASSTGAHVPKRQVEELALRAAQDFDTFYETRRQATKVKTTGQILVISSDGKGVPVRRDDLRPATLAAASKRKPHLSHRRSKGEKPHTKRMATVAAVYTIARFHRSPDQIVGELFDQSSSQKGRPRPESKRVWASLKDSPKEVITQAFEEAFLRDPSQKKEWVALVDGNPSQLKMLEAAASQYEVKLRIILDLIHVLEYLWKATWALHEEKYPAAEAWVSQRLEEILKGHSSQVAGGIRRSATMRGMKATERRPLDKCADYLLKNGKYLRYDEYLEAGYPIATGVIEGACRHLVKDRMEVTGARWRIEGAEAVLRLRALRASGDFEEYWEYHLKQEYQRHHARQYADGQVPEVLADDKPENKIAHLRLVK